MRRSDVLAYVVSALTGSRDRDRDRMLHRAAIHRAASTADSGLCSIRPMKNMLSIVSTLCIALALTLTACGKDKKPAQTEPATAEPAAAEPAKPDPAAAAPAEPKAEEKPKTDEKAGGW
jgi:hypothetical protein